MKSQELVSNIMDQIAGIKKISESDILDLKAIIYSEAESIDNYAELYAFVRNISTSDSEFNSTMGIARENLLSKHN